MSLKIYSCTNLMHFPSQPSKHCVACSLGCHIKTTTKLIFLLYDFKDRRFILTADLNNLSTQFFFSFLIHRELLPFHLKKALL